MLTLVITAIASATAAYICSHVWKAGTLPSAAAMPVLVALVKEGLRRPTEAVVPTVKGRVKVERRPIHRHWKLAVLTGIAGFALFAFIATTTELLAGKSIGGRDSKTTLFGGTRTVVEQQQSTVTVQTVTTVVPQVPGQTQTATTTTTTPAPAPAPAPAVPTTPTQPAPTPTPAPDGSPPVSP
jgi:hypothetical protein